jgi:hypothetical protein
MTSRTHIFRRVQERHYSAHHTLLRVARFELGKAELKEVGWFDSTFVVLTFSALAIEALSNAIGDRIVPDWEDFESANPLAKVRLLAERLNIPYSPDSEPWRTIRWLGKFRNLVAHPKPEAILGDQFITEREADNRPFDPPKSKLERKVTIENAKRAFEAVEKAKLLFCEKIPIEERFGLFSDGWLTKTSRHDPDNLDSAKKL